MIRVQERLREAVNAIQHWLSHTPAPGEAVVRQAIVLRLLHVAGFDIWNPEEVVPEETNATGNRADFMIRVGNGKFALELKGMNVTLSARDYQQVITYAGNEGTPWAVLTNGRVWVILDRRHNPGGTFQDHEVLKLELGQEANTFADDFAVLFDPGVWREDAFAIAVETVQATKQQRLDEARIRKEKIPIVEDIQNQYKIPTFELAAQAAVEMNRITEAERDVLIDHPLKKSITQEDELSPLAEKPSDAAALPSEIEFTYRSRGATAIIVYRPNQGTWTMKAGSTARNHLGGTPESKRALEHRRNKQMQLGQLEVVNVELLRFTQDVEYTSPSIPAVDISGAPKNGWDVWKDVEGRPAQYYRPIDSVD